MEYILILLLIVIIGFLFYTLKTALDKIELYEQFIVDRRDAYYQLLQNIRDIDAKQIFEKDDEVGVTFDEIKNEIEEFKNIIE
jgi:Tfp pilus assembly protein PilO